MLQSKFYTFIFLFNSYIVAIKFYKKNIPKKHKKSIPL